MDKQYRINYIPRLLRLTGVASKEDLHARVSNSAEISKRYIISALNLLFIAIRYPFLELFFQFEEDLELIKNIIPIVEWASIIT